MADTAKLDRLVELAPWNRAIAWATVTTKNNEKPTPEQTLKAMEPFLDYDLKAMTDTATMLEDQPEAYARVMRKAAEFNPKSYITLMDYLREHQLEAEAAAAYEAALAHEADPVMLSNHSDWVVNYYFEHGKKDLAEKAAAFAAEVYSHQGLATMARLRERQGRPDEAEQWLGKIAERYDDPGELIAFYRRSGGEKPDSPYAKKLKDLASPVFPKGFQKVELKDFQGPPQQGVLVAQENDATRRAGLKLNDVIVALNGDRTDTFDQYAIVRRLDAKPDMRIILYREETGYLQITCSQRNRTFAADFVTYQGKGAKRAK
jgi:tetratricopeptide (TPR) repeat protein